MDERKRFVVLGFIINLCMGNLYAWSVFRVPLQKAHEWSASDATFPFTVSIAFFALGALVGGHWQDGVGPKPVVVTGGILLGGGFILSSSLGGTLANLSITYGVFVGLGIGFTYVTAIAVTVKWWPDKRGLMTGTVIMGFSTGAIMGGIGGPLLVQAVGVYPTFFIFGILFSPLVAGCGAMLRNPPTGWKPEGWTPRRPVSNGMVPTKDYSTGEMIGTGFFWCLWLGYFIAAGVALTIISQASPIGQEMARLTPLSTGGALMMLAAFNMLGRPGFGAISDSMGRENAWVLVFAMHLVSLVLILPNATTSDMYTLAVSVVGFAYGGTLALTPAFTADSFGTKDFGLNYGWLFTAWCAAGIIVTEYAAQVRAAAGSWPTVFTFLSGMCVVGLILAAALKAHAKRN